MFNSKQRTVVLHFVRSWGAHIAVIALALACIHLYQRCEELEVLIDDAHAEILDANDAISELDTRTERLEAAPSKGEVW